ncbi:Serine/Threonine kinase domain protein (macronuclear) [Tetrahymena thermophila SB210]|uniref:Serine/Threonine kinase domain protein n=1 Tax=Tetrahymena thermophila (strain SB210) TaxID=312017 RepID=I7MAG0_TETTS|nr:Serine/Threonine kinase domain protein [Tetrahymena thermophila SB210]EAS04521.1 Serine/Threonine kinase domain protein [Tetrahymena thermophila SB210]|eukprot:XP_001024766.1 Serine/Threonine kinase domain protein [Tetrahymena thermophila SB210]
MGKVKTLKDKRYLQGKTELGKGAFAIVYPGKDTHKNKLVAIKKIDAIKNKDYLDKIDQECQLHQSLLHNCHVLEFIDNFSEENYIYIITELCEFGDLDSFVNRFENRTLPEDVAKLFTNQILLGFIALYDLDIIHRDMKLQNILINKNFECKIADFGLAKSCQEIGHTYAGTPLTMAPEVLFGLEYNKKCDVWSFGCIVYAMTHGRYPFFPTGHNKRQELEDMVRDRRLEFINPQISKECKQFIDKMLKVNPEERIDLFGLFNEPWLQECSQQNYSQNIINKYLSNQLYKEVQIDNDFANEFGIVLREFINITIKYHCSILQNVYLKILNKQNQSKQEKQILYLLNLIITKITEMAILFNYNGQKVQLPLTKQQIQMFKDVITEENYQKSKLICDKISIDLQPVVQTLITSLLELAQIEIESAENFSQYKQDYDLVIKLIDLLTSNSFGIPFQVTIDEEKTNPKKLQSLENISIKEAYVRTQNEENDDQNEEDQLILQMNQNKIIFKSESKNSYEFQQESLQVIKQMIQNF